MARVYMPLGSFDAKGAIAKGVIFSKWRGINYAKRYFIPANPQSADQTSLRLAFELLVAYYKGTLTQAQKDAYDVGAKGEGYSGFNLYMSRGMNEYISQIGIGTDPVSVSVAGNYPSDVYTWT